MLLCYRLAMIKNEKKAKEREKKEIEAMNRKHLSNMRVVQKSLVYVIGLPAKLANDEVSNTGACRNLTASNAEGKHATWRLNDELYPSYLAHSEATRVFWPVWQDLKSRHQPEECPDACCWICARSAQCRSVHHICTQRRRSKGHCGDRRKHMGWQDS